MFESLQATCYGVISSFFVLSTITIILRIYSRGFIVKSFGWDDGCMASILVSSALKFTTGCLTDSKKRSSTLVNKPFCITSFMKVVDCKYQPGKIS